MKIGVVIATLVALASPARAEEKGPRVGVIV